MKVSIELTAEELYELIGIVNIAMVEIQSSDMLRAKWEERARIKAKLLSAERDIKLKEDASRKTTKV
jgi:hypothetical protein